MEGSHYCGRVAWKRLVAAREGRPLLAIGVATSARPRFLSRAGVITGDFVTEDAGCGVVHCAPAFGEEDYKARYSPLGLLRRPLSTRATPP